MQTTVRWTLASGARVVVQPVAGAAATVVQLAVDAGAADEAPHERGAAHFVEHMLFKGTERLGVGEVADRVEALGGDVNAWTSHEQTVLHASIPGDGWRVALEVLGQMAFAPLFDPDEVEREREVILDEIVGGDDDPGRVLADAVARKAWSRHPYGAPVIGTRRSVRALTREGLLAWWRRVYVPSNTLVVVVGDVEPDEVRRCVEELLTEPAPYEPPPRTEEPPQRRRRTVVLDTGFEEPRAELAFRVPGSRHPDLAALEVLVAALGWGTGSVLERELKHERGLVAWSQASLEVERDGGLLHVDLGPREGRTVEAVEATLELLQRVVDEGLDPARVRRARTSLWASRLFERETVEGRAQELVWSMATFDDPTASRTLDEHIASVGLRDVHRVARRWLDGRRLTLGVLAPGEQLNPSRLRAAPRLPLARAQAGPKLLRRVLPGGLRLVVEPCDGDIAGVRLVGLGGRLLEQPSTAGAGGTWARTVATGTADLDLEALDARVEELGATLGAFCGVSSQGLRLDLPAVLLDEGLELLLDVAARPAFEPREVERVLAEQVEDRRLLPDDPGAIAAEVCRELLFDGHPWSLPPAGDLDSLARIDRGRLRALHRTWLRRQNLVLAISAPCAPHRLAAWLDERIAVLPEGRFPRGERARLAPLGGVVERRVDNDRGQAQVLVGWRGCSLHDPDRHALALAASILGRQAGRLFMALREREALCYGVWAHSTEGWDGGWLGAGLATDPKHADRALDRLVREVESLAAGPSRAELDAARRLELGALATERQRAGARAMELALGERYGVRAARVRAETEEGLAAVTVDDVARVMGRLADAGRVQVVVGA